MIYLNHAATTYPKPQVVLQSVTKALTELPRSQYRSVAEADYTEDVIKLCRRNLAQLFQVGDPERIFFTGGSTQALNQAILGLKSTRRKIVITATEHNAVLRTVYDGLRCRTEQGSMEVVAVPCDGSGYVDMEQMRRAVTEDTALVAVNHCSNVTGAVQDVGQIGAWAHEKGAVFLVDASQSAGVIPIDVEAMGIDLLAFTAHKGLYGIEGCGGLFIRKGIELRPLLFGGTGKDSEVMIPEIPFYEVGTANVPGIAALNAGVEFILEKGPDVIMQRQKKLVSLLYQGLTECEGVKVYADRQPEGTAVSFCIEGLSPADVGYILSGSYQILVRTGLHCAPLIHEYLGSGKAGTVRVSISYMTTEEEIACFLKAVREISDAR